MAYLGDPQLAHILGVYGPITYVSGSTPPSPGGSGGLGPAIGGGLPLLTTDVEAQRLQQALGMHDIFAPTPVPSRTERTASMLDDLKNGWLEQRTLDDLLLLETLAHMLAARYTVRRLDPPDWLGRRQRAISKGIESALDAEIEDLQ